MKKLLVLSLAFLVLISFSIFAQEKEMKMQKQELKGKMQEEMGEEMPDMKPPQPLSSDWYNWMVGEWTGWSETPMGKTKDWIKFEWGLDKQFVVIHYKGEMVESNEEMMKGMQEQMNMSDEDMKAMMEMPYKGMGVVTMDPKSGGSIGYWFDNWRSISTGKGKMESATKGTMVWESAMGTETRTTEKVGENKMVVTFKSSGAMGEHEGRTELTRVMGMKSSSEEPVQGSGTKSVK